MVDNSRSIKRSVLEEIIFGGNHLRRYTQDSPVLPDVWMAYCENLGQQVGLILQPCRDHNAGETALAIHKRLISYRSTLSGVVMEERKYTQNRAEIAHLPGVVVLRLYFDELVHVVLPFTNWWDDCCEGLQQVFGYDFRSSDGSTMSDAALQDQEQKLSDKISQLSATSDRFELGASTKFTEQTARLVKLLSTIYFANNSPDKVLSSDDLTPQQTAKLFIKFISDFNCEISALDKGLVFNVGRNRDARPSVVKSSVACKADAARLLFNVSCQNITWAIADSGIEHRHPAFHNWRHPECGSRVIRTYDFTRLRSLLSIDIPISERKENLLAILEKSSGAGLTAAEEKDNQDLLSKLNKKKVEDLLSRIEQGFDIDWAILEQFIRLDQKDIAELPDSDHGTHVAGILGADWPCPDALANFEYSDPCGIELNEQEPKGEVSSFSISLKTVGEEQKHNPVSTEIYRKMTGMCPDIKLMDMRVLRTDTSPKDARSDEFEVMAALQFVRFLNGSPGSIKVHGINLSLSVAHDVANYACGRTPICLECDETVSSGVVVVAAAGNRGYESTSALGGYSDGNYNSMSITDPGNAEKVITTGATHRYKPHEFGVSYFSSRGPTGDGRRKPDIVAPGEKIVGPTGLTEEASKDGTSMAAPHVSGAAAMLMARHPELIGKPERIKEILCVTATDLGREHYFQGNGMLDTLRALQSV